MHTNRYRKSLFILLCIMTLFSVFSFATPVQAKNNPTPTPIITGTTGIATTTNGNVTYNLSESQIKNNLKESQQKASEKAEKQKACDITEIVVNINGKDECAPAPVTAQNKSEAETLQKEQEKKNAEYVKEQGKEDVTDMDWVPVDSEGKVYKNPKWHPFKHPLVTLNCFPKWALAMYADGMTSIDSSIFELNDSGTWQNFTYMPNFKNDVLNKFISFFTAASWITFGFGLVFTITETAVAYENGQGNGIATMKNVFLAFIFTTVCTYLMAHLFSWTIDVANQLGNIALANADMGTLTATCLVGLFAGFAVMGPWGILGAFAFFCVELTKYHMNVLRRGVTFLGLMAKSCLIPFNLVRGITGNAQGFIDQFFSFLIGMILQIFIFRFGLSLFAKGTIQYMLAGLAFMTSSDSVYQIVGSPSAGGSGSLMSDLHSSLHIAGSLDRANKIYHDNSAGKTGTKILETASSFFHRGKGEEGQK